MKIGDNVVIEGTATIENLPISNSSLSAIVQTDGNLFKRELGTISTASKESYIPGLSIAFPSIFNLNTESLDYNNRSLVVSLKNQLQGTVFMGPVSMNGTPAFRRILKSDLTDSNVVFTDDNTFVKKIGDTMTGSLIFSSTDGIVINNGPSYFMGVRDMGNISSTWARGLHKVILNGTVVDNIGHFGTATQLTYGYIGGISWNSTNAIRWTSDGRVGIGLANTNSPQEVLDVNGSIRMARSGGSSLVARDRGGIYIETPTDTSTAEMIVRHKWTSTNLTFGVGGTSNPSAGSMNSWGLYRWNNDRTVNGNDGFIGWTGDGDNVRISALAGSGVRMVTVGASGDLYSRTIPDFDGFVKKTGDTMSGDLNFSTAGSGLKFLDLLRVRFSSALTIIAGSTSGIEFRPVGYGDQTKTITFDSTGKINTSTHGDSSQWKQAFDRGDHAGLYLVYNPKATLSLSSSSHNLNDNLIGSYEAYVNSGSTNKPTNQGGFLSQRYFQSGSINYISQIYNTLDGNEMYFRVNNDINGSNWNRIWHSGNLIRPATQSWVQEQGYDNAYALLPSSASTVIGKYYAQKGSVNADDVRGNIAFYTQNNTVGSLDYCHHLNFGTNSTFNWQLRKAPTNGGGFGIRTRNSTGWTPWENIAYESFVINQLQNFYTKTESLDLFVGISNVQTIGGTKTFSNSPIVPTATLNSHAINKGQIESWVDAKGYSTQTLTAGTNIQINANNVISATNTTYSAGTLALLNTGTDTANRVWPTKVLADYVTNKIAQGADSIWEHTSGGGIRITNYDSLATRDGAIAIGRGSGSTKYNAIGIGTAANSDGNSGLAIGELSANTGTYGLALGPYSVNTAMEGVVIGPFLQNNQRGCTVTGRYNHPILSNTNNTINDFSPLFIIGNGKSASIRSNAYEMFSDGKGEFANVQSYKTQPSSFNDLDIPNWKFIQDNISGGGNGSEDYVSDYGSQISVFLESKANEQLSNSPYGGSGEILTQQRFLSVDKPTLVYLGNDGVWRKWNNAANAEEGNLTNRAVLGIALSDMKSVLLRGYYLGSMSIELETLVADIKNGNIFHSINKGLLMAGSSTSFTERVFGYSINESVAYFNPWMF